MKKLVFVVDDDQWYAEILANRLRQNGDLEVKTFNTGEEMLNHIDLEPSAIVLDYNLDSEVEGAKDGGAILEMLNPQKTRIPVILLSGQENIGTAVKLLKFHASDYIVKNDNALDNLAESVDQIFEMEQLAFTSQLALEDKSNLQKRWMLVWSACLLLALLLFLL